MLRNSNEGNNDSNKNQIVLKFKTFFLLSFFLFFSTLNDQHASEKPKNNIWIVLLHLLTFQLIFCHFCNALHVHLKMMATLLVFTNSNNSFVCTLFQLHIWGFYQWIKNCIHFFSFYNNWLINTIIWYYFIGFEVYILIVIIQLLWIMCILFIVAVVKNWFWMRELCTFVVC